MSCHEYAHWLETLPPPVAAYIKQLPSTFGNAGYLSQQEAAERYMQSTSHQNAVISAYTLPREYLPIDKNVESAPEVLPMPTIRTPRSALSERW